MSGIGGQSGPSIVLHDGQIVEQSIGASLGERVYLPRRLVVTRSRLYLGCTTLSAEAVEFVIRTWRQEHPAESC